jgi:hypothetical protein
MRPEAVEYVLERFEAELVKALENLSGELDQMRRRKEELESEVTNSLRSKLRNIRSLCCEAYAGSSSRPQF